MKKQKKKIPFVANMSCEGEVQCPLCNEFFSLRLFLPEECRSDSFECPACLQMIGIDKDTIQMGNAIINKNSVLRYQISDAQVLKRVQWHLDVPVCSILAGIKAHVAAISMKERFWLFYHLGGETAEDLVRIIWELIRL